MSHVRVHTVALLTIGSWSRSHRSVDQSCCHHWSRSYICRGSCHVRGGSKGRCRS